MLTAYSPLGSPDSLSMMGRDKSVPVLLENKELNAIAKKLGKNAGQASSSCKSTPIHSQWVSASCFSVGPIP